MKREDVLACSMPKWYPKFCKITFETVLLDLPDDVLAYLRGCGSVVLPAECEKERRTTPEDDDVVEDETEWDEDEESENTQPSFPDFCVKIKSALDDLGGRAFCKLNWSAPRDASWIAMGNSLAVEDLTQLFLLLKSSDFVRHDLTLPFKDCEDQHDGEKEDEVHYSLALRRWADVNPGHEFRCFVIGGRLAAVSQRDPTHFYRHVGEDRLSVLTDLKSFFSEQLSERFPSENFVFDVVRKAKDEVTLVDFGPFGPTTDPLLFDWEELYAVARNQNMAETDVDFRYVLDDAGIQPNGLRQYSLPLDMVDLASGRDPDKLIDFLKLQTARQENGEDSETRDGQR